MNGNELLDKMELIEPAYVEAADQKFVSNKNYWKKWMTLAACLCLTLIGAFMLRWHNSPQSPEIDKLQAIAIPKLSPGGMGFEGYLLHDIAELNTGNPWSENTELHSMPVYKNKAYDPSGAGIPIGLSESEMETLLSSTASALNLEISSIEKIMEQPSEKSDETSSNQKLLELRAQTNYGKIFIAANADIIYFLPEEGVALPEQYSFTDDNTTNEQAEKTLAYLLDKYQKLHGFHNPIAFSTGKYYFSGDFQRLYFAYDKGKDNIEDILNYNFRRISFQKYVDGKLAIIRLHNDLLPTEKMGDYPIISAAEATRRLLNGNYQTSVPTPIPGKEFIAKKELIYRRGPMEEILLPYYRFYVLLPEETPPYAAEKGLKTYGAYYVPAIVDEYIVNMPTYDGRFN